MIRNRCLLALSVVSLAVTFAPLAGHAIAAGKRDAAPARPSLQAVPRELMPEHDWRAWYRTETGRNPSGYFGAYAVEPRGRSLYLGFGTARPAESDGALLARYEDEAVEALYQPSEQGFLEMVTHRDKIYFPGPDPCCPDGWDFGNTYAYDPATGTTTKHRTMPNVFHAWGLWPGPRPAELFAATSAHDGDYGDSFGQVMHTTDGGATWTVVADDAAGLGAYRTYDIHGVGGNLFAVWNDVYELPCGLAMGDRDAATWQRLPNVQVVCRTRLADFRGRLIALRADRAALLAVDPRGEVTEHPFDGFLAADWAYNYAANAGNASLVVVADDGRVMASPDLQRWRSLADVGGPLLAVAHWPEARSVVVARRGADPALWQVPLGKR